MDEEKMTMVTPLDPSLDVSLRLANLRIWQRDFQHIDRKLEEQLHQLDGNNLLQLQQAVHISNLRRRMEMMLVRQPLSIPEGVRKQPGSRGSAFPARSAIYMSDEGGTSPTSLNSFLFFMTADLRKLDDKIAHVRAYRSLGQTRNFLLGGESGMGKTTYLDWLMFHHLPTVELERNRVPIIGVEANARQNTAKPLLWRMLLECGQTYLRGDNEEVLLDASLSCIFKSAESNCLSLTRFNTLSAPPLKRRVLEVSNMARGIPMICASCHPIEWTEGD
jgi:hypothetical protein